MGVSVVVGGGGQLGGVGGGGQLGSRLDKSIFSDPKLALGTSLASETEGINREPNNTATMNTMAIL